jgi:predicted DNA binding CopG/RHH family protein
MLIEDKRNDEGIMMKGRKSKLEQLTSAQIEEITARAEKNPNVPRVTSQQVNMRLDGETLARAKKLAVAQGIPYTSYLTHLLKEDIERLWKVFKKTG